MGKKDYSIQYYKISEIDKLNLVNKQLEEYENFLFKIKSLGIKVKKLDVIYPFYEVIIDKNNINLEV